MTHIDEHSLMDIYQALLHHFGNQHWWPSDDPFETIIGAILAQNVSWKGASRAVQELKRAGLLFPEKLKPLLPPDIAPYIKSSRYYNQKAEKISRFVQFFYETYAGSIEQFSHADWHVLRQQLLSLKGFGPETVDSILLYACNQPVFVVDAYTRRIGSRRLFFSQNASYLEMQDYFMKRLNPDIHLYNDFHAQIVCLGKSICRKTPLCSLCPVRELSGIICAEWNSMQKLSHCHVSSK